MEDDIKSILQKKIKLSIEENKPITLIVATGWGKNWKAYSAPHLNWAEYFHCKFLYDTIALITKIYEPGVILEFSPDDFAVIIINEYKKEWLDIYKQEFIRLLQFFDKNTPSNFSYVFHPSSEWYDFVKLKEEIDEEVKNMLKDPNIESIIEPKMRKAINNVVFKEGLTETEKQEVLRRSVLVHDAWLTVDYRHRATYLEGGINIPIAHRKGIPGCYCIRNTPSSLVQYWKGVGILAKKDSKYYPEIISPNQFTADKEKIDFANVDNPTGIEILNTIPFYI